MTTKQLSEVVTNRGNRAKAVAVAKDILAHLDQFSLTSGSYCDGTWDHDARKFDLYAQMQSQIDQMQKHCKVCAVGACFMSFVRLYDRVTFKPEMFTRGLAGYALYISRREILKALEGVFDSVQLDMIEAAFMRGTAHKEYAYAERLGIDLYTLTDLCDEAKVYADDDAPLQTPLQTRLRMIAENIIANDGVFNPFVRPKQEQTNDSNTTTV